MEGLIPLKKIKKDLPTDVNEKLVHGDFGNFIKGQKLDKKKEKKYKEPPYKDLAASVDLEGDLIEKTMTPAQKRKDTMLKKKYDDSDMKKNMQAQYGKEEGKKVYFATIRKQAMGEALDSDDKPFVKKLVGKLRKGSKTHAKQADDLEKALKEEPLTKQSLDARKQAQSDVEKKMNKQDSFTTTNKKDGKITSMSVTGGKRKDLLQKQLRKSGTGVEMDADGLVPNVGAVVQKKAEKGMNIAKNTMDKNPDKFSDKQRKDFKTADSYLKSGEIEKNIQKQIPGSQQFRLDIAADEVNLDAQKYKPKKNKGFMKLGVQKEDISDEALNIQDWNSDDIKFTEIETVDIIKPKPLKPSPSNWREDLGEDWQKVNRKDKTDGLSKKAVKAYRRENPGSKLQTAVTTKPSKLKKGSKSAKRRLSFCRRMKGMKKKLTSAKTRRDPDSRINKALRRWNC